MRHSRGRAAVGSEGCARAPSRRGRAAPARDPSGTAAVCWASAARCALHWWLPEIKAWLSEEHDGWSGWDGRSADEVEGHGAGGAGVQPWRQATETSEPPVVRWFRGALTSAAFNEVDRAVLAPCRSVEKSFLFDDGAHLPVGSVSCRELLRDSVIAALSLKERPLAVGPGERAGLCFANGPLAVVWAEALKRCTVPFVATAAGSTASALRDRALDTRALALVVDSASADAARAVRSEVEPLRLQVVVHSGGGARRGAATSARRRSAGRGAAGCSESAQWCCSVGACRQLSSS